MGAVVFYLTNIGIIPSFINGRVDNDGHHKELTIPEGIREDITVLEGSIEELVKSGQVGQDAKLQPSADDEQTKPLLPSSGPGPSGQSGGQNQFSDDIIRLEDRFENIQPLSGDDEIDQDQLDLLEQLELIEGADGPDSVFEFNPL